MLFRENALSRAERVQTHLDKLLDAQEKAFFKFDPPKKEEFPLAFAPAAALKTKKQSVDAAQRRFKIDDFLRRQFAEARPLRIREQASFELYGSPAQPPGKAGKPNVLLPLLPLTEENVKRFEELTKHQSGPVDLGFNLKAGVKTDR